jgi:tetratricopeptide (TPR) repeat protein
VLIDERAEPHRAARFLGTLHNAQWRLGRGAESLLTLERALSLLPPGSVSRERGMLLRSWAATMMLRGRNAEAVEAARETLRIAEALGDASLRGRALNALGTALMNLGDVEEGASALREAPVLAERAGLHWEQNVAYINLGDALQLAGRLAEARAVVEEGLARELRPNRVWLVVLRGELAIEAGQWDRAETILSSTRERQIGNSLVNLDLRRAELALARGQYERAYELLDEAARVGAGIDEPQLTGVLGALRSELERRRGDLGAARGAVRDALASLEMSTDDAPRQARVSAAGTTVEADAAQRARDVGDPEGERVAIEQADLHVARVQALVDDGRPLETAWLLVARAERTRAGGAGDPRAFAAAADAWTALERPYRAAVMRFRQAEAYVSVGDRAAAANAAREAHATTVQLGAGWLSQEIERLAARAHGYACRPATPRWRQKVT